MAIDPVTSRTESRARIAVQVAVDLAILTVRDDRLQILLVERGNEPYKGQMALPGGFLREGEDLLDAARRELQEETNVDGSRLHLEELRTYSAPDRDPRGRVISVAFLAIAPNLPVPVAGTDAIGARWMPVDSALSTRDYLAFDHYDIASDAVERARAKIEYTTLATVFCGETFTIGELRNVYEVVWGVPQDPRNFSRKVKKTEGFVEATGEKRFPHVGRPAMLYRAGPATTLYPAMLRENAYTDNEITADDVD